MTENFRGGPDDVRIIQRERLFSGCKHRDRCQRRPRIGRGGVGAGIEREPLVRHDAVCVLPYDPQRDEVVLVEQFRMGAMARGDSPWLVETVAGLIDKDEQPEEVARREAVEEAGLEIGELWPVTAYYPSPGGSTERIHLYV